jgi:hypothetical protein
MRNFSNRLAISSGIDPFEEKKGTLIEDSISPSLKAKLFNFHKNKQSEVFSSQSTKIRELSPQASGKILKKLGISISAIRPSIDF